tara:strand:+ start:480 stop:2225 length:1746 start_codon:yes stop_codon:yes gene_type:complete
MNYLKLYFKKVFFFIDKTYNKKITVIGILIFLNMFLELLSVGLIFPLVGIILDPAFLDSYPTIKNFFFLISPFKFLDVDITFHLISGALLIFLFLIILKNIFVFFYNSYRQNFIYKLQLSLKIKSLQRLIGFPYDKFLKENNADLITKNKYLESISVAVENFLVVITEVIVLFSFIVLFFLLDPISMSIIIFTIFPAVFLLSKTTRKKLLGYGDERRINDTLQLQYFTNILNGIKEIKLFNNHQYFLDFFYTYSKKALYANKKYQIITLTPRLVLEIILALSLCIILIKGLLLNNDYKLIISTTAVFMASAIKLMPSLNKILVSINSIKYYETSINILYDHEIKLRNFSQKNKVLIGFKKNINFKNVSFGYSKDKKVLENINLEIVNGDKIGIVGSSGMGKSTIVNLISGLLKHSSGDIYIDNNKVDYDFTLSNLSLIPQNPFFANSSIKENLCFGIDNNKINLNKVREVLKVVELFDLVNRMDKKLDTIVGEKGTSLSGGQLQRLGIARSLYSNPDILILDESTNALDKDTQKKIINNLFLNYKDKTIIIISHDHNILGECNKIYKIENKRLLLKDNSNI